MRVTPIDDKRVGIGAGHALLCSDVLQAGAISAQEPVLQISGADQQSNQGPVTDTNLLSLDDHPLADAGAFQDDWNGKPHAAGSIDPIKARELVKSWTQLPVAEKRRFLTSIVRRIVVCPDCVDIAISPKTLIARFYPRETQEMVFDAHDKGFCLLQGGVHAGRLRQHEDGGGSHFQRQGAALHPHR